MYTFQDAAFFFNVHSIVREGTPPSATDYLKMPDTPPVRPPAFVGANTAHTRHCVVVAGALVLSCRHGELQWSYVPLCGRRRLRH